LPQCGEVLPGRIGDAHPDADLAVVQIELGDCGFSNAVHGLSPGRSATDVLSRERILARRR
jgi:hypothetical protein